MSIIQNLREKYTDKGRKEAELRASREAWQTREQQQRKLGQDMYAAAGDLYVSPGIDGPMPQSNHGKSHDIGEDVTVRMESYAPTLEFAMGTAQVHVAANGSARAFDPSNPHMDIGRVSLGLDEQGQMTTHKAAGVFAEQPQTLDIVREKISHVQVVAERGREWSAGKRELSHRANLAYQQELAAQQETAKQQLRESLQPLDSAGAAAPAPADHSGGLTAGGR